MTRIDFYKNMTVVELRNRIYRLLSLLDLYGWTEELGIELELAENALNSKTA